MAAKVWQGDRGEEEGCADNSQSVMAGSKKIH